MRASEFRNDPGLVSQWKEMLEKHALLRLVMDTMEQEHPARFALNGDNTGDISPTRAGIELGMTRGYSKYSDTLKLLAVPMRAPQPLPETDYAGDEPEVPTPQVQPQPKRRGRPPKNK